MTWQGTRNDVQAAIGSVSAGLHREMGVQLLADFDRKLAEYGGQTQISETAAYVTWATTTVPNFLAAQRALANEFDGNGTTAPYESLDPTRRALENAGRLREAAELPDLSTAERALLRRATSVNLPKAPTRYTGNSRAVTLAPALDALAAEAEAWLELVT